MYVSKYMNIQKLAELLDFQPCKSFKLLAPRHHACF